MPFRPGIDDPPMRRYTASFWQPDRPRNHPLVDLNKFEEQLDATDSSIIAGIEVFLMVIALVFAWAGLAPFGAIIAAAAIGFAIILHANMPSAPLGRYTHVADPIGATRR